MWTVFTFPLSHIILFSWHHLKIRALFRGQHGAKNKLNCHYLTSEYSHHHIKLCYSNLYVTLVSAKVYWKLWNVEPANLLMSRYVLSTSRSTGDGWDMNFWADTVSQDWPILYKYKTFLQYNVILFNVTRHWLFSLSL